MSYEGAISVVVYLLVSDSKDSIKWDDQIPYLPLLVRLVILSQNGAVLCMVSTNCACASFSTAGHAPSLSKRTRFFESSRNILEKLVTRDPSDR